MGDGCWFGLIGCIVPDDGAVAVTDCWSWVWSFDTTNSLVSAVVADGDCMVADDGNRGSLLGVAVAVAL